jgi:hypothetical protein
MAVGGVAINMQTIGNVERRIQAIRDAMNISSEIKWNNVKPRRDNGHFAYADLLKELVEAGNAHFHIRFQRMEDWDHRRSGPRRKTDTVSKAFYQLVLHRPVKFYGSKADIHIRPDKGDCTEKLHEYIGQMNTEASRLAKCGVKCVKSIEVRDSKETPCLQLLDVTLGALAAIRNERHMSPDISQTKRDLALHVHGLWSNRNLSANSLKAERKFVVWNAQPRK